MAKLLAFGFAIWQVTQMRLTEFLTQSKQTPTSFAAALGVPASTVTRWVRGERVPSLAAAQKIEAASNGLVKAADLLPVADADLAEAS